MTAYTAKLRQGTELLGSLPVEVEDTPLSSPRIEGERIVWDAVPGATSYKTYYNGTYTSHPSTARSWDISPKFPGETRSIGWTYFDGADHWISPELQVTFAGSPPPPPPPPGGLRIGLVPGGDEAKGRLAVRALGMNIQRSHDKSPTASVDSIEAVVRANADAGAETIVLMGSSAPSSPGNVGAWASALGPGGTRNLPVPMRWIEWGNEDSFSYKGTNATAYANSLRAAYNTIKAANPAVKLLGQLDEANRGPFWIDTILSVWPEARTLVDGWTVHPYGPPSDGRLQRNIDNHRARGLAGPIYITEDGMSTDNGRCLSNNYGWDPCMTYSEAAAAIEQKVNHVLSFPEVVAYLIYKGHDDRAPGADTNREYYFGVYKQDGSNKDPYTAKVIELVAR